MRVTFVMRPDGNLMRGGAELLVDRTRAELVALGVEVDVLTPESRQLGDLVHFFGCYDSHWSTAEYCIRRQIPYVCTPIFSSSDSERGERARRIRQKLRGRFARLQYKLFAGAARIIVPTRREERRFAAYFGLTPRFERIPHGVDDRFATADPELFRAEYDVTAPFVFHSGGYSPTKNQLGLIRAMKGSQVPLVFAGHTLDPDYRRQCEAEREPTTLLLDSLPHEAGTLPSAYRAASAFALPSFNEAFCLAAMEAAVAGCPLVLGNRWEAEELYGDAARYVDPVRPVEIRSAVLAAFQEGKRGPAQAQRFLADYSWRTVTEDQLRVYEAVLSHPS